ncbi:MAG TPA: flagellar basal-body MS-ring/collar protein FliF [Terriglobia bacterium]|jgi:flagellar M-ring protein FliF|nr:flagellar basal-body MS-ring/collar protein FliF [Terriglobia bacterium]
MASKGEQILAQAKAFLQGLTPKQRLTILAGVLLVATTLWIFVRLIGRADYKPLYSGLQASEAQAIAQRLAAKNIPYELSSDGTSLRVPSNQLDAVRLEMAAQGLPQSGRLGFELFDKPNWAGSDFTEKVNYQRALEGELERTIQTIREVEAVRVHLVMPHDSLFTEQAREGKASVVVKLRGGRLADETIESITYLVASAVDNLRPENVTVIDADGHVPLLSRRGRGSQYARDSLATEAALSEKLVETLTPVVGANHVKANVTVEYDLGTTESTQETYDPNGSVVLTSQVSQDQSGDPGAEGIPGTPSNVPGSQAQGAAADAQAVSADSQSQRFESKTYAVSKTLRHVSTPSGGIKRIAAAVLVDDATEVKEENGKKTETRRKRTPEEMKQIQEIAMAAIGFDQSRGDKLAVENLSFQTMPAERVNPPTVIEKVIPVVEKWMGLLRYLALGALFLLVYLLILRPVKKQVLATFSSPVPALQAGVGETKALADGSSYSRLGSPNEDAGLDLEAELQKELAETSSDVKRAVMLKRHLVEKVKKEPIGASRLIQNWIRQGEGQS